MITLNTKLLNTVCLAAEKKENSARYYLNGVFIEDKNGMRHYTATDGHVLLTACEPVIDDELKQPLIVQYTAPIKTYLERCEFIVNDDFVTLKIGKKPESFNIIDAQFPQYENIIPADTTADAHEFAIFSPEILKLVKQVFGDFVNRYQMTDRNAPCLVTNKTSEFKMVMMPYRYWVNNHN